MESIKFREVSLISITLIVFMHLMTAKVDAASIDDATISTSSMYRNKYKPGWVDPSLVRSKRANPDLSNFRHRRYASDHTSIMDRTSHDNRSNITPTSKFIPIVPNSCRGSLSFCTSSQNYPSTHVNEILKNKTKWINIIDEIDLQPIGNRFGEDIEENDAICLADECVIYPKVALNKDNDWFFIVNNDKYKQGVRVELCSNEGNRCKFTNGFPVRAICRQKYIYRTMVALDYYGVEHKDKFKMPSCCSCSLVTEKSASESTRQSRQSTPPEVGVEKCQKFAQN